MNFTPIGLNFGFIVDISLLSRKKKKQKNKKVFSGKKTIAESFSLRERQKSYPGKSS